jgi:hypothetical protein
MRSASEFSAALSTFNLSHTDHMLDGVDYLHAYFDGENHPELRGNLPDEGAYEVLAAYISLVPNSVVATFARETRTRRR